MEGEKLYEKLKTKEGEEYVWKNVPPNYWKIPSLKLYYKKCKNKMIDEEPDLSSFDLWSDKELNEKKEELIKEIYDIKTNGRPWSFLDKLDVISEMTGTNKYHRDVRDRIREEDKQHNRLTNFVKYIDLERMYQLVKIDSCINWRKNMKTWKWVIQWFLNRYEA